MSWTTVRLRLPVLDEVERRSLDQVFLPDRTDWPRMGKPRSIRHFFQMVHAWTRGSFALLETTLGKDALYMPSLQGACYAGPAGLYCRLRGKRVVHHFHDLIHQRWLLWLWTRLVTDFVHNTEEGYRRVAAAHPYIRRKRNVVIPCVVDAGPAGTRAASVTRTGARRVVFIGQVSLPKGIDYLLEAFTLLAPAYPDVTLDVIGSGDATLPEELAAAVAELEQQSRIR